MTPQNPCQRSQCRLHTREGIKHSPTQSLITMHMSVHNLYQVMEDTSCVRETYAIHLLAHFSRLHTLCFWQQRKSHLQEVHELCKLFVALADHIGCLQSVRRYPLVQCPSTRWQSFWCPPTGAGHRFHCHIHPVWVPHLGLGQILDIIRLCGGEQPWSQRTDKTLQQNFVVRSCSIAPLLTTRQYVVSTLLSIVC